MKKVSVIIPAFNAAKYIANTLESLINQTYENLEIIVVDDGSNDSTAEIVLKFCQIDNRVIYLFQENKGCSGAKNTGLNRATGDFIQYLDADDILSNNKIYVQMEALKNSPNKVAVCRTITFNDIPFEDKDKEIDTKFLFSTEDKIGFLCNLYAGCGMIQPNAFLISKELSEKAGPWDELLSPSTDEDSEYFCRVLLISDGIIFTHDGLNFYRSDKSVNSLSRQISDVNIENALKGIKKRSSKIFEFEQSLRTINAIGSLYSNFLYMYFDTFPKFCNEAFNEMSNFGIKKIPITGGVNFKMVAKILGMKNSLRLRARFNKFK